MSRRRIIVASLLFAIWYLIPTIPVALGQDTTTPSSKERAKNEATLQECADSTNQKESLDQAKDSNRDVTQKAFDQIVEQLKQTGDSKNLSALESIRDQFATEDESRYMVFVGRCACEFIRSNRKHSELLSARQMVPNALRIADAVKEQSPTLFMFAHGEAACMDMDFERYDSALKHMSIVCKLADDKNLDRRLIISLEKTRGYVLRKLKRFDEAEKIYLESIKQI